MNNTKNHNISDISTDNNISNNITNNNISNNITVKDVLDRLGLNMLCDIQVHWDYQNSDDSDHRLKADNPSSIIEIFGDWYLDSEDCIYFSQKDEHDYGLLDLYIKKPEN